MSEYLEVVFESHDMEAATISMLKNRNFKMRCKLTTDSNGMNCQLRIGHTCLARI